MAKTTPQTHVETPEETAAVAEAVEAAEVAEAATEAAPATQSEAPQAEAKAPKVSVAEPEVKAEAPAAPAAKPADGTEAATNFIKRANAWLESTFPSSKNAVLGGVAGLIVALLFFAIGFWRTVFIVALVLVGVGLGQYADGDPKLARAITKLIKKR